MAKAGVKGTDAVISVSGRELIIKRVPLPKVPRQGARRRDLSRGRAPHPVRHRRRVPRLPGGGRVRRNSMSVILVAVKKVKVLEYIAVVEEAGLEATRRRPRRASPSRTSTSSNVPGDGREAVALIDIGAIGDEDQRDPRRRHPSSPATSRSAETTTRRPSPSGSTSPFEQAEAAKHGQEVGVNWDDLVPALEAVSRELSLEVQRTFDYFASTAESERIGKIVLSGGCAQPAGHRRASCPRRGASRWSWPARSQRGPGRVSLRTTRAQARRPAAGRRGGTRRCGGPGTRNA